MSGRHSAEMLPAKLVTRGRPPELRCCLAAHVVYSQRAAGTRLAIHFGIRPRRCGQAVPDA